MEANLMDKSNPNYFEGTLAREDDFRSGYLVKYGQFPGVYEVLAYNGRAVQIRKLLKPGEPIQAEFWVEPRALWINLGLAGANYSMLLGQFDCWYYMKNEAGEIVLSGQIKQSNSYVQHLIENA